MKSILADWNERDWRGKTQAAIRGFRLRVAMIAVVGGNRNENRARDAGSGGPAMKILTLSSHRCLVPLSLPGYGGKLDLNSVPPPSFDVETPHPSTIVSHSLLYTLISARRPF